LKIAVAGKAGSITHWLEDVAAAWRADGHEVRLAITRRPWLAAQAEAALAPVIAERLRASLRRFQPDLIVVIGGYHIPEVLLEAISSLPGRAPLAGWVGDVFTPEDAGRARLYDAVGYADSALLALHRQWALAGEALYLPHAVDPGVAPPDRAFEGRDPRMVFVANPTPLRRAVVSRIEAPIAVFGPGWRASDGTTHDIHPRRVAARRVPTIYGGHRAALNIRNELNVLSGLNQRNFEPCLAGAALLTDDQPDLESCFESGSEVLVWRDADELNALYQRVLRETDFAVRVAEAGRARVLAQHTFAHRLVSLSRALGFRSS
jgi:spore maturation protein CgeB